MFDKGVVAPATNSGMICWIQRRAEWCGKRFSRKRKMIATPRAMALRPTLRESFSIPQRSNYSLAAMHLCLNLFQLVILPLYLLPRSLWWGVSIVPIAAMNNPFWALIHEAIHDLLSADARANAALGRALAICFGSPFQILRLTHLSHHKFNRSPLEKGTEIYNPAEISKFTAAVKYFFYILCGLYLLEVVSPLAFYVPLPLFRKMRRRVIERGNAQERWLARKFKDERRVREIRLDGAAIIFLFGLSAYWFRAHLLVFAGMMGMRTFLISFMDNVYHYRTRLRVTISGHNLFLPERFSSLILHFNLHRVHHAHPSIPWNSLPVVFARRAECFDRSFCAAAWQQIYGPVSIYDPLVAPASNVEEAGNPREPQ
ncbi:MAG: fatty acid desaturase [Chloroflexota bacterium]